MVTPSPKRVRCGAIGCIAGLAFPLFAGAALAQSGGSSSAIDSFEAALTGGKISGNFRYRFEFVDQGGIPNDAKASTLRSRLGYQTGWFHDFSAMLEFEDIHVIGEENYNDTVNGKVRFPVVVDPEDTEVNQAFLTFRGLPETSIWLGRQRVKLDNDRFIGNVGFRQNEQTFDALRVVNDSLSGVTATYVYIDNVNRIFGDDSPIGDHEMNSHLVNVRYTGWDAIKVAGYAYLLDYDSAIALSSQTYGLRAWGSHQFDEGLTLLYSGEYAHQSDFESNPASFDHDYYLAELGLKLAPVIVKVGYEVLEGNGTTALQTPLATGHKFNGWADKFLVTPASGLEDAYVSLAGNLFGVNLLGFYHVFDGESGGADLGDEINLRAVKTFRKRYSAELKAAFYEAEDAVFGLTDTDKIWLSFTVKL